MNRVRLPVFVFILLPGPMPLVSAAETEPEQARAIAEIERLGATVTFAGEGRSSRFAVSDPREVNEVIEHLCFERGQRGGKTCPVLARGD
jgi:hypothetical protein